MVGPKQESGESPESAHTSALTLTFATSHAAGNGVQGQACLSPHTRRHSHWDLRFAASHAAGNGAGGPNSQTSLNSLGSSSVTTTGHVPLHAAALLHAPLLRHRPLRPIAFADCSSYITHVHTLVHTHGVRGTLPLPSPRLGADNGHSFPSHALGLDCSTRVDGFISGISTAAPASC